MAPSGNTTVTSTKMLAMDWEISRVSEIPEWSPKTMEDTKTLSKTLNVNSPEIAFHIEKCYKTHFWTK